MVGHAVSNVVPVVAANRIGTAGGQRFYGHSFICDERGDMLAELGADETGVLVITVDTTQAKKHRADVGFFRDRWPDLYGRVPQARMTVAEGTGVSLLVMLGGIRIIKKKQR